MMTRFMTARVALVAAVGTLALTPVAGASPAQAAQAHPGRGQLQVLSPQPGAVIVAPSPAAARALHVDARLRATGRVAGLAARLNGHPLPGVRTGPGEQRVLLDAAGGLTLGENLLWVSAQVDGQAKVVPVRFYAGYQARGILGVQLRLGAGTAPAALATLTVPATGVDRLDVRLNGRPVMLPPAARTGARRVLNLAQLGAVRFGENQLQVRVVTASGAVQALTRTFTLPGTRDIAVARLDGAATVGHAAALDATPSLLAPGSAGLAGAHWTLLRRPANSHAQLETAIGARTTLRPDVPGDYLIALRVGTGPATGADLLTVAATDPEPLVPLNTIAYDSAGAPGVQVGADFYPDTSNDALQVLVLDRATLGLLNNYGLPAESNAYEGLQNDLSILPNTDLVIVTHPGNQPPLPADSTSLATLNLALNEIGGSLGGSWSFGRDPQTGSAAGTNCWSGETDQCDQPAAVWAPGPAGLSGGSFTVIGVPGMPAGQAWRETAAQNHTTDGNITGYLTLGITTSTGTANQYTVVPGPDPFVPVDTCTASGCAVQVGDQTYPPAAGVSGFHVVVLDRTTLQLIANTTVTTTADLDTAITGSTAFPAVGHFVFAGENDGQIVIIQSVGDGKLSGNPGGSLFQHLDQLGGTDEALNASITGAYRYALVGAATDLPWHATTSIESSTAMPAGPDSSGQPTGQISGVLQRDRDGLYTPSAGDPVGPANNDLYQILYQPTVAWPYAGDPGLTYIADNIDLAGYPDVRSAYTNLNIDFASKAALLQGLTCTAGPEVCGTDFPDLKTELLKEFDWVQSVRALAANLLSPYEQSGSAPYFDVQEITNEILASIPVAPDSTSTMQWLQIMTTVMGIANKAAGPISPEAAAVFGVLAGAGTLATQLMQTADGGPADAVKSAAGQLADQMALQQTAYVEWVDRMEVILLSDYGRLSAVGTAIGTDATWAWTPDTTIDAITALGASTRASAYTALLPVAWGGYNLKPGADETSTGSNDVTTYICDEPANYPQHIYPFAHALPQNQFHAALSFTSTGTETDQVWTFANTSTWYYFSNAWATLPGTSLTDNIYGPQSTGPDGAFQYGPAWWRDTYNPPSHTTCQYVTGSTPINDTISQSFPPPSITPPPP